MSSEKLIQSYCKALLENDLTAMLLLFSEQATVQSPLYPLMKASDFFRKLFQTTYRTKVKYKNVFSRSLLPGVIAAHLELAGGPKNGVLVEFEAVDIFELDANQKIQRLTIIYDTYPVRLKTAKPDLSEEQTLVRSESP